MTLSCRFRIGLLLLFVGLLHGACSDGPLTAEEQLRGLLDEAEKQLEARDLSSVMAHVDPAYSDSAGRDFRALKALLFGYLLRHKTIHILSRIDQIELMSEAEAQIVVFAGLAGSPQEAETVLSGWRADLLRLQLLFVKDRQGEWLLHSAQWRRAAPEDFAL